MTLRAFVTGATGFLGLNLVKRLVADGWEVTALHRPTSDLTILTRFDCARVVGDVTDRASLEAAMPTGVDAVFHTAASTNLWAPGNHQQTRINWSGARNVVDVALRQGAGRLVHTSSMAAYAPRDGEVTRETTPSQAEGHWVNYFRTKWLAEQEVRAGIARGLDAVILNPGNILGPHDLHNWSRMIQLVKAGRVPGVFPGAGPWCHVDSVVAAHLAAFERGRTGENYLLGSVTASYAEAIALAAELTGSKAPPALPAWLLRLVGRVGDAVSRLTGKEPDVTPEIAEICCARIQLDCSKAERELGYREVTLRQMFEDTVAWLEAEGRL